MRDHLTPRRRQIIELVAAGMDNFEIARALYLSPDTVKSHLALMFRLFEARNRAHLVAIAMREGWIG